jgi:hypothetical protein
MEDILSNEETKCPGCLKEKGFSHTDDDLKYCEFHHDLILTKSGFKKNFKTLKEE